METPVTMRVMAIHALAYCRRLFYLEEVEGIYVANDRVWAGRRLHEELSEDGELVTLTLESARLGLRGKLDAVRKRDGQMYPVEHKRGRCRRETHGKHRAWESDELQVIAYAALLAEHLGTPVAEGRVRYHGSNVTVSVLVNDAALARLADAVAEARQLSAHPHRPPICDNERLCIRCSLAPVCLPEEARFAQAAEKSVPAPVRLFPPDSERVPLHVVGHGSRVGRKGEGLNVSELGGGSQGFGVREISDVVVHGNAQVSTQALRLCADHGVAVHFFATSGAHIGTFCPSSGGVQRRIRQYEALTSEDTARTLASKLVRAKVEMQLRFLLRSSRNEASIRSRLQSSIDAIRGVLKTLVRATCGADGMVGYEGACARANISAVWIV